MGVAVFSSLSLNRTCDVSQLQGLAQSPQLFIESNKILIEQVN
jgi:hypothetical protein